MIYAGYEHGQYFMRFTHDIRIVELGNIFGDGYKFIWQYMLLLKHRSTPFVSNEDFYRHGSISYEGREYEEDRENQ